MGFNDEFQALSKEGTGVLADLLSFPLSTPGIQNILIPMDQNRDLLCVAA